MIFVGALLAEKMQRCDKISILIVPILALVHDHLNTLQKVGKFSYDCKLHVDYLVIYSTIGERTIKTLSGQ